MLMVITAFAWYLAVAGNTDVSLLFTIGTLGSNLFAATAIHLLLAFPSGRLLETVDRAIVGVAYLTTTIGWLPFALYFDPRVFDCADCPENLLVVEPDLSLVATYLDVIGVVGIVVMVSTLLRLAQRWRSANAPLRRAVGPVFLAGGGLLVGLATLLAVGLAEPTDYHTITKVVFYACVIPFGLVPYLFLAGLVRGRWIRGRGVGALISRLGEAPRAGGLRHELARALGDPTLELAYWLPESEHYVDAEGRPFELPVNSATRAVSEVERDGRPIAAIVHDAALLEDEWHVRAATGAAALALENEQLQAELRAKVEELRASRQHMIQFGLRERRRLERDLHDGAQQRLVSLALDLRLAQQKLDHDPHEAQRLLERSRDELEETLNELRELARGIHPAVLSDRGLGPAVEALAHRAPLPVEVSELPSERLPEQVELAAYFVVAEALTNVAKYAGASHASVGVAKHNGQLMVEIADDGVGGADPEQGTGLRGLAARLDIIEGRLEVASEPGRGTMVRARIPCG